MIHRSAVLALLLVCSPAVGNADWLELSRDCLTHLGRIDESVGTLASTCPSVSEALQADPWSELLITAPDEISAWALIDLSAMAEHYRQGPAGAGIDPGSLDAVLAGLPVPAAEDALSAWDRLWTWLRDLLGEDDADLLPDWVSDFSLSEDASRWIWYSAVAAIVLLALALVANEVRQQSRRRWARAAGEAMESSGPDGRSDRASGAALSPAEQLQALFRDLIVRLQELGTLPRRPSLTHRELAASVSTGLALPEQQSSLVGRLSLAAERAMYGSWEPDLDEAAPYLHDGRRLLCGLPAEGR